MDKLLFGIELELCVQEKNPQYSGVDDIDYIKNIFLTYLTQNDIGAEYFEYDDQNKNYFVWIVTTDDSIRCKDNYQPVELTSPIIEYNKDGVSLFTDVMYKLQKGFDFEINNTQGLHINISYENQESDIKERRFDKILRFFECWWHYEPEILNLLPERRRNKLGFARPLTQTYTQGFEWFKNELLSTEYLFDESYAWPKKDLAVNLRKDRFEIRLPPSYIRSESIVFWLTLFLMLWG